MTHQLSLEHSACYQKVLAVWFQAVSAKTNSSWTQNMNCSKNQVLLHGKWWEEARRMNMNTGAFAALSSQIWQIISTQLKMTTALKQVIPHFPSVTKCYFSAEENYPHSDVSLHEGTTQSQALLPQWTRSSWKRAVNTKAQQPAGPRKNAKETGITMCAWKAVPNGIRRVTGVQEI